jgi:Tfp pilus assembly major pilin PilA
MNTLQKTQQGASTIVLIILLAIVGSGAYIGLQYLPQYIEAGTVESILGNIEKANKQRPVSNVRDIQDMIDKQLNMNQMDDLKDSFTVTQDGEAYIIRVSYERELNLIYEKKSMKYEKSVTLK